MEESAYKTLDAYTTMKRFLELGDTDGERLAGFLPRVEDRLPTITDAFYEVLQRQECLLPLLNGRIETLKATHVQWLRGLFCGDYGEAYCREQLRIGFVHVKVDLDSSWVDAVMSVLRKDLHAVVLQVASSDNEAVEVFGSLIKVIDLSLMTINMAYNEHRMRLLHEATGMAPALIERLIKISVNS